MFSLELGILEKVRAVMLPFLERAKGVLKDYMVMIDEGSEIMSKLLALDVTVWRIAKECGVSYQTGKACKRGWWKPDASNSHKLFALLIKVKKERGLF